MKRFTEALKWRDPWFRGLSVDGKLAFFYLVDNCDQAGVWEPDYQLANFCLQRDVDWTAAMSEFGDRLVALPCGKLWLTKFIPFQYGRLTAKCAPHRTIISLAIRHGLNVSSEGIVTLPLPLKYPPTRVKETEKEEETEKDLFGGAGGGAKQAIKEFAKTDLQRRAERLFNRRETTVWDGSECKAWERARAAIDASSEDDWQLLEWFYARPPEEKTYRRKDLATLLNNWNAEIDRARAYREAPQTEVHGKCSSMA